MDSKTIAEISACADEKPEMITHVSMPVSADKISEESNSSKEVTAASVSTSASNHCSGSSLIQGEENVINSKGTFVVNPSFGEAGKGSKSSVQLKNHVGKKKVKWNSWVWIRLCLQGFWSSWELIVSFSIMLLAIYKNIDHTRNMWLLEKLRLEPKEAWRGRQDRCKILGCTYHGRPPCDNISTL